MSETGSDDKPSSLADAVQRLGDHKSTSRVYNALVFIRTNYAKGSDAATKLRHLGGECKLIAFECVDFHSAKNRKSILVPMH